MEERDDVQTDDEHVQALDEPVMRGPFQVKRLSDPTQTVEVSYEDRGGTMPAFAKNGAPYRAYTMKFTVNGEDRYSQVDAAEADASGDAERFRMEHDLKALRSWDIDPDELLACAMNRR